MIKRIVSVLLTLLMVLALGACANGQPGAEVACPTLPKPISFDDYEERNARWEENMADEDFARAVQDFAGTTAAAVLIGEEGNAAYSPVSLYMALSLAASGAKGETEQELLGLLGLEGKDGAYLSEQNARLFRRLFMDNKIGKLSIANSLWLLKGHDFCADFLENAKNNFYSSAYNVDFSAPETAALMSEWVAKNTNSTITPKIEPDADSLMTIFNTLYLKDEWVDRFDEALTAPGMFTKADGTEIECDFMNAVSMASASRKGENYLSASRGLKNLGSMVFILPDSGTSTDEILSAPDVLEEAISGESNRYGEVVYKMPKFSFGYKTELEDMLAGLGAEIVFDPASADFTGISPEGAYISKIQQETHIAVDENGLEASAFTSVKYCGAGRASSERSELILDRPFICAVTALDGGILFLGVVNDPLAD